jgi:hypothetical protein
MGDIFTETMHLTGLSFPELVECIQSEAAAGLHVYSIPPFDFWDGWLTEKEYLQRSERPVGYYSFRAVAFERARAMGWEGDIREGPYVAGLPYEERDIIVAWKQDNNGQTFIASPVELPWLEKETNECR